MKVLVAQLCLLFATPWTVNLPGSSVQGVLQARIPEWAAIPSSRGLPHPGIEPGPPTLQADSLPSEPRGKPYDVIKHSLSTPGLGTVDFPIAFSPPSPSSRPDQAGTNQHFVLVEVHRPDSEPDVNEVRALPQTRSEYRRPRWAGLGSRCITLGVSHWGIDLLIDTAQVGPGALPVGGLRTQSSPIKGQGSRGTGPRARPEGLWRQRLECESQLCCHWLSDCGRAAGLSHGGWNSSVTVASASWL